ncbi:MAG: FecR domain-containing protein, partial [Sedimentitalea sp.]|nr:FecR domain-containing protein [Sedimentitalea sp.]
MSLQTGGAPGAAPTPVVLTAPEGAPVVIPDTHSLFDAEFARDGRDLVISNPGAPELRISGYFHPAQPADLQSPDGAVLRGDLAARLAGPEAPGQYAQAGLPQGADPIGQVETVGGEASVQRTDGVREPLTVGTKIFLDDVIETGSGGTLSVTFVDGTIFTLSPGSRMIIDELVYTPAGQSNSGSFNLIQGGFVFIAGQVARTGGMDVNTPAATMGIRGTTVLAEIETRGGVSTAEITLTPDPDGQVGRVAIFDLGGNLITTITDTSTKWIVSTLEGDTREVARSAEDAQADNVLIAEAVAAYDSAQARFQSGGSFIELNTLRGNAPNPSGPDEEDGGVDLDSIDDPLAPELSPEDAPEQSPQRPTLDEGRNQLDPEPEQRTIVVTGFEDLNEDS